MQEKRNSFRAAIVASAEITEIDSGTRLSGRTSDIGLDGCYVDTLNTTPANTAVRIVITHADEKFSFTGRVVYVSPRLGMGIRFDDNVPAEQRAILERWTAESS